MPPRAAPPPPPYFYLDRDYGLIRFEQRDGTSWTLAQ